jgi:hypothetical protein
MRYSTSQIRLYLHFPLDTITLLGFVTLVLEGAGKQTLLEEIK